MAVRIRRRTNSEARMSLGQHLLELRRRLTIAGLTVVGGAAGGWFLAPLVWDRLREPILMIAAARGDASINYPSITSSFDIQFQVSLMLGIVIASPVWLYQIFAFLVPGLNKRERRYIFGFFFSAVPLFLAGCAVGWLVVPRLVEIMVGFVPTQDTAIIDARYYLDFVLKLILASGIAFVLPVFLVLLNFLGVVPAKTILKGWRWAILAITVFTAIATPAADPISMLMLAAPMIVLYFLAVGIALLHDRRSARKVAAFESSAGLAS